MSAATVSWVVLGAAAGVIEVWAVAGRRTPTAGRVLGTLMHPAAGRIVLLAGWVWLGWHLFAR